MYCATGASGAGFDVNFMDDMGQTLLNWAAAFGPAEMVGGRVWWESVGGRVWVGVWLESVGGSVDGRVWVGECGWECGRESERRYGGASV